MSIVKKNDEVLSLGVKPAVAWSTVGLVGLGVVLCVLDQLGVIDVDDTLWITLIGAGVGAGGLGAAAPAALQRPKVGPYESPLKNTDPVPPGPGRDRRRR